MTDELNNDLINTNTNRDESQIEEEHDVTMIDDNNTTTTTTTPDLSQQYPPYLNGHINTPIISNIGDTFDHLEYDARLTYIADSNNINVLWTDIQPIIRDIVTKQCDIMVEKINDTSTVSTINDTKISILHCIDQHTRIPFTIQRICELIISPSKHYNSFIKYLNAVHKVLSVVSSWDTFPETTSTVNGINSNFLFANYDFAEVKYTLIKSDDDGDDLEEDDDGDVNNDIKANVDNSMETDENKNIDQDNTNDNDNDNEVANEQIENNSENSINNNNEDKDENQVNNNDNDNDNDQSVEDDDKNDNDNNNTDEKNKTEETSGTDKTSEQ